MKARSKKALRRRGGHARRRRRRRRRARGGAGTAPVRGRPGPAAIASYLGLTPAQLRAQLRSGKTLAQIAVAQGKTVAGLEAAIYADVQAHLDQAVANGRLTATQEQAMLDELKAQLDDIVNHAVPALARRVATRGSARGRHVPRRSRRAELRTELRAGKSLARSRPRRARPSTA